MPTLTEDWPADADGGVFRRLAGCGFDFSKPHTVDYYVDFGCWPPERAAIDLLGAWYNSLTVHEPDEHGSGYVRFQVCAMVTYEGVTTIQRRVSAAMAPYGGVCKSWGVMQDAL